MKLTVFGATGRTGRHLLTEGARRGHQLTAFARRPQALDDPAALATSYADNVTMEGLVAASGLDWTIVRLNRLTNKAASGRVHISRGLLE
jgi:putative NADH-flavin reductase